MLKSWKLPCPQAGRGEALELIPGYVLLELQQLIQLYEISLVPRLPQVLNVKTLKTFPQVLNIATLKISSSPGSLKS